MKIMALSREYFVNRWNVFDLVIVLASLLDLGLEIGSGLSVLRGMRLVSTRCPLDQCSLGDSVFFYDTFLGVVGLSFSRKPSRDCEI